MTSKRTLTILYALHSWVGIVVGLWIFVVAVTGAALVFKNELDLWANPSLRDLPHAASPVGPDVVLASLRDQYPGVEATFLSLPNGESPSWLILANGVAGKREKFAARADTGRVVGRVDSELGQFIRNVHVFVLFGPRWLVGFLGVLVSFLVISGFVLHRKVIKELFTLRWGRSSRVVAADAHRAFGVWGLPFHVLIAFTGAWLGLAPVFERAFAYLAGPPEAARASVAVAGAPPPSLDRLLERARRDQPGVRIHSIALTRWGQPDARVRISGDPEAVISSDVSVTYAVATGAVLERDGLDAAGFWRRCDRLMEPLHFGDFAGIVLRWLYFVLGLGQAALAASGTLVWFERRKHKLRGVAAHTLVGHAGRV